MRTFPYDIRLFFTYIFVLSLVYRLLFLFCILLLSEIVIYLLKIAGDSEI